MRRQLHIHDITRADGRFAAATVLAVHVDRRR